MVSEALLARDELPLLDQDAHDLRREEWVPDRLRGDRVDQGVIHIEQRRDEVAVLVRVEVFDARAHALLALAQGVEQPALLDALSQRVLSSGEDKQDGERASVEHRPDKLERVAPPLHVVDQAQHGASSGVISHPSRQDAVALDLSHEAEPML